MKKKKLFYPFFLIALLILVFLFVQTAINNNASPRKLLPDHMDPVDRIVVERYHREHTGNTEDPAQRTLVADWTIEITQADHIQHLITTLRSFELVAMNRPMSGTDRLKFTCYTAQEEAIDVYIDSDGTCCSSWLDLGNLVVDGDFHFDSLAFQVENSP